MKAGYEMFNLLGVGEYLLRGASFSYAGVYRCLVTSVACISSNQRLAAAH